MSLLAVPNVAQCANATRDWRYWPFSQTSPWNYPIGTNAQYASVNGLSSVPAGITTSQWTSAIIIASDTDRQVPVYSNGAYPGDNWDYLNDGGQQCGVSGSPTQTFPQAKNAPGAAQNTWSQPATSAFHPSNKNFQPTVNFPAGACPSPDTDGLMSTIQPSGWALDTYATVTFANNGGIVSNAIASFFDLRGDGSGCWNGRRASMIPSMAGLIRTGELAAGSVPHALSVTFPASLLTTQAVWPAWSYDTNGGYSGTVPMGSLLAIPQDVELTKLGLSPRGLIVAKAARDYGVYVVDRGGGGVTIQVEENDPDVADWPDATSDATIIIHNLQLVTNGVTIKKSGHAGALLAPLAPPFSDRSTGTSCP